MRARVCVVGGGIAGVSVAYHLAKAGWDDVVLVDKGELTGGSTHHAAGLVTTFNAASTMMRMRRYSVELYEELGVFGTVGSVRVASSPESWIELKRTVSRAAAIGLDAELISARECVERLPECSPDSLHGGVWMPGDGHVDPHITTHALADAARALGVIYKLRTPVTGIELGPGREVRAVVCGPERIEAEHVVIAAGIWAPQLAAMAGAFLASTPVDHQHVAMHAVDGHEIPRDAPCFRDPDNLVYGRAEAGGLLVGGYEHDPVARWSDGVPWEHGASPVASDMDRFAPLLEGAIRRFPYLEDSGVVRLLCHPDAMTPDGNPLVGPMPGITGLWAAAGLSLNGFGGAGGIGKSLAELMTTGETEFDIEAYRPWRFGGPHRDPSFTAAKASEAYRYYYRLRYPHDTSTVARGRRLSPLHGRLEELGAVFGTKNGWERADHFEPGRPWRRSGEDQRGFGWTRPPWHEQIAAEHAAFRERVGIADLSSFGKIEVSGPDALALLEHVCDNAIDRPVGRVAYTQMLDARGGIVGDVTVTRLASERFRVVTGAGAIDSDLGWLRLHSGGRDVGLRDVTEELAVIALWGPHARDVLDLELAFAHAREIEIGGAPVLAQQVSYVGEHGYELYVAPEWAVQVWDRLMGLGASHGIRAGGYRVLDSLRIEKGMRVLGSDLTPRDTPHSAGLSFCVAKHKDFLGAQALREAGDPSRVLRTLAVGGEDYLPLYGGEAVRSEGEVIGRVRSAAYGFTEAKNLAVANVPRETGELQVDVLGDPVGAVVLA